MEMQIYFSLSPALFLFVCLFSKEEEMEKSRLPGEVLEVSSDRGCILRVDRERQGWRHGAVGCKVKRKGVAQGKGSGNEASFPNIAA